ncbi:MAG: hypothetical protein LUF78_09305 [Clostridiales bacterium]|nr:hypothetical protein [Clostridiales bacterium]
MEANCDICPACYSKQKQKTAEEKLAGYNLPEIEAASKKQKAYACKLRARFVAKNEEKIDYVNRVIKISKTDGYRKKCEDIGESPELYFERNIINNIVYRSAYICLTETNAGKVVDELAL